MKRLSITTLAVLSLAIAVAGCGGGGVVVTHHSTSTAAPVANTTRASCTAPDCTSAASAQALGAMAEHNWTEEALIASRKGMASGGMTEAQAKCATIYIAQRITPEEIAAMSTTALPAWQKQSGEEEAKACW
jgi:hypothetical protein